MRPLVLIFALAFLTGCGTVIKPYDREIVIAKPPATRGEIHTIARNFQLNSPSESSGFQLIKENDAALLYRQFLIDNAVSSIDAQYFIWDTDVSGYFLLTRLIAAAERGVRVRLLVDDVGIKDSKIGVGILDHHPNISIRIFNPKFLRKLDPIQKAEFVLRLYDLNRRMHNKLLVADGKLAMVGGRNIGDAYFGLSEKFNFLDLDVAVTGQVVFELAGAFDQYWNSKLSVPARALAEEGDQEKFDRLVEKIHSNELREDPAFSRGIRSIQEGKSAQLFQQLRSNWKVGKANYLQDDPELTDGGQNVASYKMENLLDPEFNEITLVTPYFVPVRNMLNEILGLARNGTKVSILVPSMGANNHTIAHSHYRKFRRTLLEAGVELYEFRHDPSPEIKDRVNSGSMESEYVAMHLKTAVGGKRMCYVGSLNLDRRGYLINAENGFFIDSPALTSELARDVESLKSGENAWRVTLQPNGGLQWESADGVRTTQPALGIVQRAKDFIYRFLPVASQL